MPTKLELIQEAARRGILPEKKKALYHEAVRRGLIKGVSPPAEVADMPSDEGIRPLESYKSPSGMTSAEERQYYDPTVGADTKDIIKQAYEAEYARPMLETGGMIGGGIIGSGAAPIAGTLAGAGLGYAGGAQLADIYDYYVKGKPIPSETAGETALKTGRRIATGAAYEAGGQIVGNIIGRAILAGKQGYGWLQKHAGKSLVASTDIGEIYAKNALEAEMLEDAIPGLKFTRAQRIGGPKSIKAERALLRKPGEAAAVEAELRASNTEALRKYMDVQFPDAQNLDDVVNILRRQETNITQSVAEAEQRVGSLVEQAGKKQPEAIAGARIREGIKAAKGAKKAEVSELFEAIPEANIEARSLLRGLNSIRKSFDPDLESAANMPTEIIRGIFKKAKKGKGQITFSELRKVRTRILDSIRDETGSGIPNAQRLRRLNQILDEVDNAFLKLEESNVAYREAAKAYREQYVIPFKQGGAREVLAKERTGAYRLSDVDTARRFWTSGAKGGESAKELIAALGKENASNAMRNVAANDMLNSTIDPTTGEIVPKKLYSWISKHKDSLKSYGLLDEFNTVKAASKQLDQAKATKDLFNKTALAKFLGTDPEIALRSAIAGHGNMSKKIKSLVDALKDNKSAMNGLQDNFAHMIMKEAETTGVDIAGNPIVSVAQMEKLFKKYQPSLKVLYSKSPEKLKALNQVREAYKTLARNIRSPIGGGSDTAELLSENVELLGAAAASKSFRVFFAIKRMIQSFESGKTKELNLLLTKAMIDPKTASELIAIGQGKLTREVITDKIDSMLATLAFYGTGKEK